MDDELNKKAKFFKLLKLNNFEEMKKLSEGDKVMEKITKKVEELNVDYDILNKLYKKEMKECFITQEY